jgi:metal-dependent amidase/aminoacylase/carboxypeptidase family protein
VFTDGGDKPNIVPAHATAQWMVRSGDLGSLGRSRAGCWPACGAGAEAAGCDMEVTWREVAYADMLDNDPLADAYAANAAALGRRTVADPAVGGVMGSTDMGNVSYLVPSIHPMIQVSPPDGPSTRRSSPELRLRGPRPATGPSSTGPWPWPGRSPTVAPARSADGGQGPARGRGGRPGGPQARLLALQE